MCMQQSEGGRVEGIPSRPEPRLRLYLAPSPAFLGSSTSHSHLQSPWMMGGMSEGVYQTNGSRFLEGTCHACQMLGSPHQLTRERMDANSLDPTDSHQVPNHRTDPGFPSISSMHTLMCSSLLERVGNASNAADRTFPVTASE